MSWRALFFLHPDITTMGTEHFMHPIPTTQLHPTLSAPGQHIVITQCVPNLASLVLSLEVVIWYIWARLHRGEIGERERERTTSVKTVQNANATTDNISPSIGNTLAKNPSSVSSKAAQECLVDSTTWSSTHRPTPKAPTQTFLKASPTRLPSRLVERARLV